MSTRSFIPSVATCSLLVVLVAQAGSPPAQRNEEIFPFVKGAVWVYKVNVKWTLMNSNEVRSKELIWTMEIVDIERRGGSQVAAFLRGHPCDLNWYQEGIVPGNRAIVGILGRRFYLLSEKRSVAYREFLERNRPGTERGFRWSDKFDFFDTEIFLDLPLEPGKRFGDEEQMERPDAMYVWFVEKAKPVNLQNVPGLLPPYDRTEYQLIFRTNPDHTIIEFVPGVGITRYVYSHHGTVSEVEARLIEFRRGRK